MTVQLQRSLTLQVTSAVQKLVHIWRKAPRSTTAPTCTLHCTVSEVLSDFFDLLFKTTNWACKKRLFFKREDLKPMRTKENAMRPVYPDLTAGQHVTEQVLAQVKATGDSN
ncbi:hypothetical protein PoB_005194500 [Plakobranchus ocellatus]|uniref:Uncharacterized protein n=1 Tax=Plakobranchus ocellatus TaxID=259542 RepID=A0AAV4C220_9GAST|nr:hypothetical protein PoB_005194500 [Plakobranchus ocellatus]